MIDQFVAAWENYQIAAAARQLQQPFDQVILKGPTGPHLTIRVDNLNTTPPPSTPSIEMGYRWVKNSIDPTWITRFLRDKYD